MKLILIFPDINECSDSDCDQICTNLDCTNGRFTCSCTAGYYLGNDNHSCIGQNNKFMLMMNESEFSDY